MRPHLVQAWRPHLQKDIGLIEGVQLRATKMIPNLKNKSYKERLNIFNITTLETRRLRGDLIEVFKICKGFDIIDFNLFFTFSTAPSRGHTLKLVKRICHLDIRKFSFAHRLIDTWNSLDESIIACNSINDLRIE